MPRVFPHPDLAHRGGIPREGELYSKEDADRLVGQGIAVRRRPAADKPAAGASRSRVSGSAERKSPVKPAEEG